VAATELTMDERRVLVSARPLPAAGNRNGGAVLAFVDLTELRRLEGVRRDFVANVSHELKTPLTSIRGYVETLLSDEQLPPDMRRQFLEVVHKNADRLHHIVDDLLDLSRLQSGGWRPELHEVNALDVIDDVWSACRDRAEKRAIVFVPPHEPVTVLADAGGLRQVLSNLFDNALRYTPYGGRIEVTTHQATPLTGNGNGAAAEHDSFVTFEVRDTGSGIPSDALPRIFERFYRVDPARSRAEGGTGLGLSIVKHLVESMGGDVRAESELGKGTVVRFRLPASA
jgi:two-component system phosphate regulon sensor histidine kinase PhoR